MSIRIVPSKQKTDTVIPMSEMKPLQAGVVVGGAYDGTIVFRTSSVGNFEVIDLSNSRKNGYWDGLVRGLQVQLLTEPITIEIDGK